MAEARCLHRRDKTAGDLPQSLRRFDVASAISSGQKVDLKVLKFEVPNINSLLYEADRPKNRTTSEAQKRAEAGYLRSSGCRGGVTGQFSVSDRGYRVAFESLHMGLSFYSSRKLHGQNYCRRVALAQH